MATELAATRAHRSTLIKRFLGLKSVASPYSTPDFVREALELAWLTQGHHQVIEWRFTADPPSLPLPFGQGRYAAILKTRSMGTFTGTCDSITEAHCAFADALAAWLEDQHFDRQPAK